MGVVKLLSLYRCNAKENERDFFDKEENIEFFVTDYFDGIQVESYKTEGHDNIRTLAECMGIQSSANTKKGVSHHRYWLYTDAEEEDTIFDTDLDMPIITIIQVFLNPDVYQGKHFLDYENQEINESICLARLENELKKNSFCDIKWKTYRLLTSGSYAVIVRGKRICDTYDVAVAIRGIQISFWKKDSEKEKIVAFHTYSFFGIADSNIKALLDSTGKIADEYTVKWDSVLGENDQVMLRIRFSQQYHRENKQGAITDLLKLGKHLAGRYDYEISLNPAEFNELYPYIRRYKFKGRTISSSKPKNASSEKTKLIYDLMDKKLLSYINERVQIDYDNTSLKGISEGTSWKIELRRMAYVSLYETNKKNIEEYRKKANDLEKKVRYLYKYSRNLQEYMRIFVRFTRILYEVNHRRELRISVSNLLGQYSAMISGLSIFVDEAILYKEELIKLRTTSNKSDYSPEEEDNLLRCIKKMADLIAMNIAHGMNALEMFLRYLRNINYQTLQTPNFDLQTNICIEKLLVAQSQFMKRFVKKCSKPYYSKQQLFPILIPDLKVQDLSVRVLFDQELTTTKTNTPQIKLAVVYSPTFEFLCESCFILPSVFHEIAHQFRYEKRTVRNKVLWKYNIMYFISYLVLQILDPNGEYDFRDNFEDLVHPLYQYVEEEAYKTSNENVHKFKDRMVDSLQFFRSTVLDNDRDAVTLFNEFFKKTAGAIQSTSDKALSEALKNYNYTSDMLLHEKKKFDTVKPKDIPDQDAFLDYTVLFDNLHNYRKALDEQLMKELVTTVQRLPDNNKEKQQQLISDFNTYYNEYLNNSNTITPEILISISEWWGKLYINCSKDDIIAGKIVHLIKHLQDNDYYFKQICMNVVYNKSESEIVFSNFYKKFCKKMHECINEYLNSLSNISLHVNKWELTPIPESEIEYHKKKFLLMSDRSFEEEVNTALQSISQDDISDSIYTNIKLYREVTSDLFMCAMMDFDVWGYLSIISQMFTFTLENMDVQYMRIALVIQSMLKDEISKDGYRGYIQSIQKTEEEKLSVLFQNLKTHYSNLRKIPNITIPDSYKNWFETQIDEDTKDIISEYIQFLDEFPEDKEGKIGEYLVVDSTGTKSIPESHPVLNPTQRWIIRITRKNYSIIRNMNSNNSLMSEDLLKKIIFKDITSKNAYYSKKEDIHKLLCEGETGTKEISRLCEDIREIMNDPGKFFIDKKILLSDEINYILSEYEESCREAFTGLSSSKKESK